MNEPDDLVVEVLDNKKTERLVDPIKLAENLSTLWYHLADVHKFNPDLTEKILIAYAGAQR